jgi:hypothetical protein
MEKKIRVATNDAGEIKALCNGYRKNGEERPELTIYWIREGYPDFWANLIKPKRTLRLANKQCLRFQPRRKPAPERDSPQNPDVSSTTGL